LPEDLRASATTLEALRGIAPGVEAWLSFVFSVMGGQMAAVGVLLLGASIRVFQNFRLGKVEVATYAAAGMLSAALMSAVNFAISSEFRWFLVAPVILRLAAVTVLSRRTIRDATRAARREGTAAMGGLRLNDDRNAKCVLLYLPL
jgi:hypothetical protein